MKIVVFCTCLCLITIFQTDVLAQESNKNIEVTNMMELLETYDSMFNIQVSATLAGLSLTAGAFLMMSLLGTRDPTISILQKFFNGDANEFEKFYKKMNQGPKFLIIGFIFFLISVITLAIALDTVVDNSIKIEFEKMMEENVQSTEIMYTSIVQKSVSILAEGVPFGLGVYFLLKGGKRILDFYTKISD